MVNLWDKHIAKVSQHIRQVFISKIQLIISFMHQPTSYIHWLCLYLNDIK